MIATSIGVAIAVVRVPTSADSFWLAIICGTLFVSLASNWPTMRRSQDTTIGLASVKLMRFPC